MKEISIFLGANTGRGFRSLYEEYIGSLTPERLYILKGSAGCGKSGLMKRVAARAAQGGQRVIRVLCSGDPDSLDGVVLPEAGIAFFDGTSPHVLEPALTGERGFYADLSRFFTSPAEGLEAWEEAYREHYRKAYRFLAAAGSLEEVCRCDSETRAAIVRRAEVPGLDVAEAVLRHPVQGEVQLHRPEILRGQDGLGPAVGALHLQH